MSVAESIVTLGPMTQFGCLSAAAGSDGRELLAAVTAEGTARAGQQDLLGRQQRVVGRAVSAAAAASAAGVPASAAAAFDAHPPRAPPPALETLEDGAVLAVDRDDARACGARRGQHEGSAGHHALLVGQGQGGAGFERGEARAQTGRPDDAVQHDELIAGLRRLGGGDRDQVGDAFVAAMHATRGARRRGSRRVVVVKADLGDIERERGREQRVDAAPRGEADHRHLRQHGRDLDRLAADRPRRAQDHDTPALRAARLALTQTIVPFWRLMRATRETRPSIDFVVAAQAGVTFVARLVPAIDFVVAAQAGVTTSRA